MDMKLDPSLVENVVFLAMRRQEQLGRLATVREYRQQIDALYELPGDESIRDNAFRDVHARWFRTLGLEQMLRDCLAEFPLLAKQLEGVAFLEADSRKKEGGELFVSRRQEDDGGRRRTAVLRVRAELFLDPEQLLILLRRELYHVADMVDPAFGYRPDLGAARRSIGAENLLRDRYHALWSALIEARLVASGRAPAEGLEHRCRLVKKSFSGLGEQETEAVLQTVCGARALSHAELLALAASAREEEVFPNVAKNFLAPDGFLSNSHQQ